MMSTTRNIIAIGTLLHVWFFHAEGAKAQDGAIDTTFDPGYGADGVIYSIITQPDGKILIGGSFSMFDSTARGLVARLNTDGSLDSSFDPGYGLGNFVRSMAIQPDGRLLIAGDLVGFGGTTMNMIGRIHPDGTVDTTFDPGASTNYAISSITVLPDQRILIGGFFNEYDGMPRNRIARLFANGSLDPSFDPGLGAGNHIMTVTIQPDGRILIAGYFTSYDGTSRNRIARLHPDGSLDPSFDPGDGANDVVYTCVLQPDGRILIGGIFTSYDGTPRDGIARLNSDGSLDTSFDPGTGTNDLVLSCLVQADGRILIGGGFWEYDGTPRQGVARIDEFGGIDLSFDPGSGTFLGSPHCMLLQADGRILLAGTFIGYDGVDRNRITRVHNELVIPVPEISKSASVAWPNPVNTVLYLNETTDGVVVDLSGQVVRRVKRSVAVDVSDLMTGFYFLRLGSGAVHRFVKE